MFVKNKLRQETMTGNNNKRCKISNVSILKDIIHVPVSKEATAQSSALITTNNDRGTAVYDDSSIEKPVWKRLNHSGGFHDNRRLLKHRARNCECFICYREMYKLPPAETHEEYVSGLKSNINKPEIKKAKRLAKKEVKTGKQSTINSFYKYKSRSSITTSK